MSKETKVGGEILRILNRKGREDGGRRLVYGHRYWSVSRHQAQCAVVKSDCPEKTY